MQYLITVEHREVRGKRNSGRRCIIDTEIYVREYYIIAVLEYIRENEKRERERGEKRQRNAENYQVDESTKDTDLCSID